MGSKNSGNRSGKPRATGAGRKPKPPHITGSKLVFNVSHLSKQDREIFLETMRQTWREQQKQGAEKNV